MAPDQAPDSHRALVATGGEFDLDGGTERERSHTDGGACGIGLGELQCVYLVHGSEVAHVGQEHVDLHHVLGAESGRCQHGEEVVETLLGLTADATLGQTAGDRIERRLPGAEDDGISVDAVAVGSDCGCSATGDGGAHVVEPIGGTQLTGSVVGRRRRWSGVERPHREPPRPLSSRRPVGIVWLALALGVLGWSLVADGGEGIRFARSELSVRADAIERANRSLTTPGVRLASLEDHAPSALVGYWSVLGRPGERPGSWVFDVSSLGHDSTEVLERAATGALLAGHDIERASHERLVVFGPPPQLEDDATDAERRSALAAVVETSGSLSGRLASVPIDRRDDIVAVAASLGLEVRVESSGSTAELFLDRFEDRLTVSEWSFVCFDAVPIIGGRGCAGGSSDSDPSSPRAPFESIDEWRRAVTGPLVPGAPHSILPESGGVGWTNAEAQAYTPDAVLLDDRGVRLVATGNEVPDVMRLPFTSGMVVSEATFGWGTLEVDVDLPAGTGLWPAIWLLDAEACEAPGRCSGYATPAYHEIDLIETRGDDRAIASVHWFDDRLRSESATLPVPGLTVGVHTVRIDRRPGLLVWSVDDIEVFRIAGRAGRDQGPHRAHPMRLVINLAVGGSFSGDRLLGPTGDWWGDARVPAGYPDTEWSTAQLSLIEARFRPM